MKRAEVLWGWVLGVEILWCGGFGGEILWGRGVGGGVLGCGFLCGGCGVLIGFD